MNPAHQPAPLQNIQIPPNGFNGYRKRVGSVNDIDTAIFLSQFDDRQAAFFSQQLGIPPSLHRGISGRNARYCPFCKW
jgi:hypothetical protein